MAAANSVNITSAGLVKFDGTATFSGVTVTQFDVLVGAASNGISSVGPGSTGQVLQSAGNASNPAYSTATFPSTATSTGTILRADGTNWTATTATYPNTATVSQILYGSASNVISGLSTANNGMLVTSATGVPSILAGPGTTGNILQANAAAAPSFSTATYPSIATGTGTILRADGTNWVATTATYPNTATVSQILYASASNVVSGLATANNGTLVTSATGVPSVLAGPGTTGNIFQSNAAAAPSFSTATYPSSTTINQLLYSSSANTVAGLATANNGVLITGTTGIPSLLANGTTGQLLTATTGSPPSWITSTNTYSEGTYTPTLIGGTVAGTTTYTAQNGYYTRIGNTVTVFGYIAISAATGTGSITLGGLPFTIKNQTNGYTECALFWGGSAGWVWPAATTSISGLGVFNTTTLVVWAAGTAAGGNFVQMANAVLAVSYTMTYQI